MAAQESSLDRQFDGRQNSIEIWLARGYNAHTEARAGFNNSLKRSFSSGGHSRAEQLCDSQECKCSQTETNCGDMYAKCLSSYSLGAMTLELEEVIGMDGSEISCVSW